LSGVMGGSARSAGREHTMSFIDLHLRRAAPLAVAALTAAALAVAAAPPAQAAAHRAPSIPSTLVTAKDGAIVVLSTRTAKALRTLTHTPTGALDSQPVLADSGRAVAFVRSGPGCTADILSVPVTGGRTRTLVPSTTGTMSRPMLSRDGRMLAYLSNNCNAGQDTMMVRDLRAATTHAITVPAGGVLDYAFTPDGHQIAIVTGAEYSPIDFRYQVVLLPVRARSTANGRVLVDTNSTYQPHAVTRIGRCHDIAVYEYAPATGTHRVIRVSLRTGHVRGVITTLSQSEIGLTEIDYDAAGQHLLMLSQTGTAYTAIHGVATPIVNLPVSAFGLLAATW
jgi:dipeptidyl aminopeptidase/acylaminoacyl peptidase